MVYMQVVAHLKPNAQDTFNKAMTELIPLVEPLGWKLLGGYSFSTGPIGSILNLWGMRDANALIELPGQIAKDPKLAAVFNVVHGCIERETYELVTKLPYSP